MEGLAWLSLQHVLSGRAINVFICRSSWSAHPPLPQVCSDCSDHFSKNFFKLVDCQGLVHECKQFQTGFRKTSKSLHLLHPTTPFNQSRSNSAQSLQVVAAHICVKTTAETDSFHLYVVDLPDNVEPELTLSTAEELSFRTVLLSRGSFFGSLNRR